MATKKRASKKGVASKGAEASAAKTGRPYTPASVGLTAGNQGTQVGRLQDFLAEFGYIKSSTHEAFGVTSAMAAAVSQGDSFEDNTT